MKRFLLVLLALSSLFLLSNVEAASFLIEDSINYVVLSEVNSAVFILSFGPIFMGVLGLTQKLKSSKA